ncbi:HIRAN domain-containing protein [Candidatus Thioglobus sp.]|uniref:HIRAN domain-containing protein n=1 Tax=Candidatus Thioglobus sp. TaxID=2026721 RepID=UPI003D11EB95
MNIEYLDDFYIAGAKYYQLPWVLNELKIGDNVTLKPQPDNKYDDNAIEIYHQNYKLGFVPRNDNQYLAKLLIANVNLIAKVSALRLYSEQYNQVKITLYLQK